VVVAAAATLEEQPVDASAAKSVVSSERWLVPKRLMPPVMPACAPLPVQRDAALDPSTVR